ncbi:MAG: hypothetical protein C5B55_10050, partial [Blastocatellia bacterium]
FGLRETLREMDKQVQDDGADFESSTGYHRFVLELFLYSFQLCRNNGIEIPDRYWQKLRSMLNYTRTYLRPDGFAPLIGDTDSGQFIPVVKRRADDHAYVLPIGAAVLVEHELKIDSTTTPELLWFCGEEGVSIFAGLKPSTEMMSKDFPDAGIYIMRHNDLYLCFNASGPGINGRGSHGHNDALSIEVSVGGRPFIIDPGTYVYSADLRKRHKFRSTAYHSTVEIDSVEQNTTDLNQPFVIGSEATPKVLLWETSATQDKVSALHRGYCRLPCPVIHKRTVTFNKGERWWRLEDEFSGEGEHEFNVRFHFDAGLDVTVKDHSVVARDVATGVSLTITSESLSTTPSIQTQAVSRDYGLQEKSLTACWRFNGHPGKFHWTITSGTLLWTV